MCEDTHPPNQHEPLSLSFSSSSYLDRGHGLGNVNRDADTDADSDEEDEGEKDSVEDCNGNGNGKNDNNNNSNNNGRRLFLKTNRQASCLLVIIFPAYIDSAMTERAQRYIELLFKVIKGIMIPNVTKMDLPLLLAVLLAWIRGKRRDAWYKH